AVYRRECLDQLASLWEAGFWEVEVHEAIRASGQQTIMADSAVGIHHGEGRFFDLIRERYRHARRYGARRAGPFGAAQELPRIAAVPMVPAVLLVRIVCALHARRAPLRPWLPVLPFLLPLLMAWSWGEARGMSTELFNAVSRVLRHRVVKSLR